MATRQRRSSNRSGSRTKTGNRPNSNYKKQSGSGLPADRHGSGGGFGYSNPNYKGHGAHKRFNSNPQHRGAKRATYGQRLDINTFIKKASGARENVQNTVVKHAFADFQIHENLKQVIASRSYFAPTPIQDQVIPHILEGRDVVGIANTGTGKTAAFLIPLIDKVIKNPTEKILVVVPTRELANQINNDVRKLAPQMDIYSVCCIGGAAIGRQLSDLKRRHSFVIGTPGRLKDLIERGNLKLSNTNTIVLDEADRMLDMGFVNDMRYLVSKMPQARHTLLFSATLSKSIQGIVNAFLNNPVSVSVKTQETSENVDQDIIRTRGGKDKLDELEDLLIKPEFNKVLIFGRTKHGVERLSMDLRRRGHKADSIHGDKSYGQRQRALGYFKEDKIKILVATDVAARGLDIPNVSHVINYDIPGTYDDYVHRIGRTGRWGKTGKALTFV